MILDFAMVTNEERSDGDDWVRPAPEHVARLGLLGPSNPLQKNLVVGIQLGFPSKFFLST